MITITDHRVCSIMEGPMENRIKPKTLGMLLGVVLAMTSCDKADQAATATASASAPIARASARDSARPLGQFLLRQSKNMQPWRMTRLGHCLKASV
jgi:hypothetical protein